MEHGKWLERYSVKINMHNFKLGDNIYYRSKPFVVVGVRATTIEIKDGNKRLWVNFTEVKLTEPKAP